MMSLVDGVVERPYVCMRWVPNILGGDPTGSLKLRWFDHTVDYQEADADVVADLDSQESPEWGRLFGFVKEFFYFPMRVFFVGETRWVLINRRSAEQWLQAAGVEVTEDVAAVFFDYVHKGFFEEELSEEEREFFVPQLRKLMLEEGVWQRKNILRDVRAVFGSVEEMTQCLRVRQESLRVLRLCRAWGRHVVSLPNDLERAHFSSKREAFLDFAEGELAQRTVSTEGLVEQFIMQEQASKMALLIKPYSHITERELAAILKYVCDNQDFRMRKGADLFYLLRPCVTGLARSIVFSKEGGVWVLLNRIKEGDKQVGEGQYAQVKVAFDLKNNKPCAYLSYKIARLEQRSQLIAGYQRVHQAQISKGMPVIIGGFSKRGKWENKYVFLMDLVKGAELFSVYNTCQISEEEAMVWSLQLLETLVMLHEHHLIHQDIKPENVIVEPGTLTLIDFGFVVDADEKGRGLSRFNYGTVFYSAPQRFLSRDDCVHQKHDVWAAGLIIWALFSHQLEDFFDKSTSPAFSDEVTRSKAVQVIISYRSGWMFRNGYTAENLSGNSEERAQLACLLAQMLEPNMDKRLTAAAAHQELQRVLGSTQDGGLPGSS